MLKGSASRLGPGPGIRWRTLALLVGGVSASILLHEVLFMLLTTTQPPAAPPPGPGPSIGDWVGGYSSYARTYSSWENTYSIYAEAYGVTMVAALGFIAALGIYTAPRLAFLASFMALNVLFVWTSLLARTLSARLNVGLGQAIVSQADLFWKIGNLAYVMPEFAFPGPEQIVVDLETLGLLAMLMASTWLVNRRNGVRGRRAVLLSLRVAALSLVILCAEIAIFDPNEFFVHATQAQVLLDLPSFTNAELFLLAVSMLVFTTFLMRIRRASGRLFR